MRILRRLALILALGFGILPTARAAPNVVASIAPVHSLVAGVMEGVATPHLLIRGTVSEHAYTLRPSDARHLQDADLVFWVGEDLETFLRKPLEALSTRARLVALAEQPGMMLLPNRDGGAWESHAEESGAGALPQESEAHGHEAHNMHLWLDPANARRIVAIVSATLAGADPANAARYAGNADRLSGSLAALDDELAVTLAAVRSVPFIVFHDAYPYLEKRYGLNAVGSVTLGPNRLPGARRLQEVRSRILETNARCVFSEPQYNTALVNTVVSGTLARPGELDPLGAALEPGPGLYFGLLRRLAAALRDCLAPPS